MIKGKPLEEGAIGYFEEYLHGKLHKAKVLYTKIVPNREIEYRPLFWLWRIFWPKGVFTIEPKGKSCIFTATVHYRLGWLSTKLARNRIEAAIESTKRHMKEEGENLKRLLEKEKDQSAKETGLTPLC